MALYSVWDWNKNLYRVYADQRPVSVGVDPEPPRPGNVHILGAIPYDAAKTLPVGVKFMGLSHVPRGEIVRDVRSPLEMMGLGGDSGGASTKMVAGVAIASAVIGYMIARWRR
jgi:hypothetical protein